MIDSATKVWKKKSLLWVLGENVQHHISEILGYFYSFFVEFQANPGKKLCGKLDGLGKTTITVWRAAAAAAAFYFAKSR